jgi:hypothetical protein
LRWSSPDEIVIELKDVLQLNIGSPAGAWPPINIGATSSPNFRSSPFITAH